ncbi:hypothetical protein [Pseudoalteromonas qingdaonensis]|uniref:hypothetical protein n=1 Tax=Pseudoalteromonas qingdaonensis TaxID=3131913 RepID=UPI00316AC0AE
MDFVRSCRGGDGTIGVVYANHPYEPQGAPTLHCFLNVLREMKVTSAHRASMPWARFRSASCWRLLFSYPVSDAM